MLAVSLTGRRRWLVSEFGPKLPHRHKTTPTPNIKMGIDKTDNKVSTKSYGIRFYTHYQVIFTDTDTSYLD